MQTSEVRFFLAAAGLHVALPLMALLAPSPSIRPLEAPIEVSVEIEIPETPAPRPEVVAPAARVESPPTAESPRPPTSERPSAASNVDPGPVPTGLPTVEPQGTGEPIAPVAPPKASEYDGPPPAVLTGPVGGLPGLGGPAWTVPGAIPDMGGPRPAPTTSPATTVDPQVATRVLKEVLKEKDKALGLDSLAAGTVSSAVREAVRLTNAPESRASFEIRLSATGQVLSARVTSSSGGSSDEWARAAAALVASLKGRTLIMRGEYAKGAVVYVSAQSLLTLPDGSKSAIEQKGAGATFDIANIGAHKQRVVRTSYTVVAVK